MLGHSFIISNNVIAYHTLRVTLLDLISKLSTSGADVAFMLTFSYSFNGLYHHQRG